MTYEEARDKALSYKPEIDECIEYDDAFIFSSSVDTDGDGGVGACVIIKETGEAILESAYFTSKMAKGVAPVMIREFKL